MILKEKLDGEKNNWESRSQIVIDDATIAMEDTKE